MIFARASETQKATSRACVEGGSGGAGHSPRSLSDAGVSRGGSGMGFRTWEIVMLLTLAVMPRHALFSTTSTPRLSSCAFIASSSLAQAQRLHGPANRTPQGTFRQGNTALLPPLSVFPYPTFRLPSKRVRAKPAHFSFSSLRMDAGGEQDVASHFFASLTPNCVAGTLLQ